VSDLFQRIQAKSSPSSPSGHPPSGPTIPLRNLREIIQVEGRVEGLFFRPVLDHFLFNFFIKIPETRRRSRGLQKFQM
jgi:hypothetical protein